MSNPLRARWRGRIVLAIGVLIGIAAALQLAAVFLLRFEYGDIYPPYSSYRADPLGSKALVEALSKLPGLEVLRNDRDLMRLELNNDSTLLVAGAGDSPDPLAFIEKLEGFVLNGGRLVIAYAPAVVRPGEEAEEEPQKEGDKQDSPENDPKRESCRYFDKDYINISERWGFSLVEWPLPERKGGGFQKINVKRCAPIDALPESTPWRSAAYFDGLAEHWIPLYRRRLPQLAEKPATPVADSLSCFPQFIAIANKLTPEFDLPEVAVAIERQMGSGSMVLLTDSYFLSNEAMRVDRSPKLLAWLLGGKGRLIVDETHLGVQRSPGIMSLIRGYRLHGILITLMVLALLFIWRNAASLVPRHNAAFDREQAEEELGKDQAAGLNSLVRRSVPPKELLRACYSEWRQDFLRDRRYTAQTGRAMIEVINSLKTEASPQKDLVTRYRSLCKIVRERK